jgi:protocatechuate 3,4-dioxygenase beta subunit
MSRTEDAVNDERHEHDRGIASDLSTLLGRRRTLKLLGGAGIVALAAACGSSGDSGSDAASSSTTSSGGNSPSQSSSSSSTGSQASADPIPAETAGPYPADGSNGPNVLTESGIVRSDIRSSFGSSTGTADGVPLTVDLTVLDAGTGGALPGAAVYIWHCDREARYSLYSDGATDQNYLRGVQEADSSGKVSFTSVFPACYSGRWPHIHFEVYPSLDEATRAGSPTVTSQLAFPEDLCNAVYATDGYSQSARNMAQVSLEGDMVFRDGVAQQLATMTGSVTDGYVATLAVPV